MSRKYKFHNKAGLYFVSFAVVNWIDVFVRQEYLDILAESLSFCRKEKGMEVFAYCFMPSHVHLIFRDAQEKPESLLRDFKKYTSRKIVQAIEENQKESRREWMIEKFVKAGMKKGNISKFQFWQHNNHPIELWTMKVIKQKINYIHNNPVKSGFVTQPEDWKYSSARNFMEDETVLEIDRIEF